MSLQIISKNLPLKCSKKIHFNPHLNYSDNNQRNLEMTLKMESDLKSPPVTESLVYMTKSLLPLLGHDYLSTEVLLLELTTFSHLCHNLLFNFELQQSNTSSS